MKLYMVPLAPNPTKVMLYIAEREELGVQMNIEQIVVNTVKGRHREPEHLARNPFFFDQLPPRLASVPRKSGRPSPNSPIHSSIPYSYSLQFFSPVCGAKNLARNQFLDRPKIRHGRGFRYAP